MPDTYHLPQSCSSIYEPLHPSGLNFLVYKSPHRPLPLRAASWPLAWSSPSLGKAGVKGDVDLEQEKGQLGLVCMVGAG